MRRRGFTLVELAVASTVAFTILAIAWTILAQYTRAYGTRDVSLERSRKIQTIFDTLREDVDRGSGSIQPRDVPKEALTAVGFPGDPVQFLTRPRQGFNIINAFKSPDDAHAYLSKRFAFREIWKRETDPEGNDIVVLDPDRTGYAGASPPSYMWDPPKEPWIPPVSTSSVIHVTEPTGGEDSHFLAILRGGPHPGLALWAWHGKARAGFAPGTLVRWSSGTGLTVLTSGDLGHFEPELLADWGFWDKEPPKRPDPWVINPKILVGVSLGFTPPGQRPPAGGEALRDPAAVENLRIILYPPTS